MFNIMKKYLLLSLLSYVLAFNNIHTIFYPKISNKYIKKCNSLNLSCCYKKENEKENERKIIEDLKNELEDLKNRNCGEVNELYEIEELEKDLISYKKKLKNVYKKTNISECESEIESECKCKNIKKMKIFIDNDL